VLLAQSGRPGTRRGVAVSTAHITKGITTMNDQFFGLELETRQETTDEIQTALDELENQGIIERTGEMRWAERSREWQPVYDLSELGRALSSAGISLSEYQSRAS
jgi:hypothetical protein